MYEGEFIYFESKELIGFQEPGKKSVNKFNLLNKYFQRGRCRRNICELDSLSYQ